LAFILCSGKLSVCIEEPRDGCLTKF
jgi:hypothetical protein